MSDTYYTKLESDPEGNKFQCKHCEKKTVNQNTMYYHVQTKHIQDFKFVCAHCTDKKFVQKSAYLQHMAQVHSEIAEKEENPYAGVSYTCSHPGCEQVAKTKANILVHFARTHCKSWISTYSKETSCKCCDKTFGSSTAYFYHVVTSIQAPTEYASMLANMR